jgi:hypothetical protein
MSEFAEEYDLDRAVSFEELVDMMEQKAREEEADSIVLSDEKRVFE